MVDFVAAFFMLFVFPSSLFSIAPFLRIILASIWPFILQFYYSCSLSISLIRTFSSAFSFIFLFFYQATAAFASHPLVSFSLMLFLPASVVPTQHNSLFAYFSSSPVNPIYFLSS